MNSAPFAPTQTDTSAGGQWRNWSGTQQCRPQSVHRPANAEQIGKIVRTAVAEGSTVRPLGAGHSFTPVATTNGHRVQLDSYTGLVKLDTEAQTVTVRAGTRLRDFPGLLRPHGYALANQGDVDPQSAAGAVSTGTHGTGLGFTGFAGMLKEFKIVGADGVEKRCFEGAEGDAGELFRLARLGLGVFGVMSELTFDCVPAFHLQANEFRQSFEEIRTGFVERAREVDHLEFFWFPGTDLTLTKENTRIPSSEVDIPETILQKASRFGHIADAIESTKTFVSEEVINNGGLLALCELSKAMPKLTRQLNTIAGHTVSERKYLDEAHNVFVSPRRVRFAEMEYAIPLETLPEVLAEIRDTLARHNLYVSFPIEVRVAKHDDVALSTAYGRDSAYIAIHRYWKEDYRPYFQLIEPILKAADGRPHWGKLHTLSNADLRDRYPLFDEVAALRNKLDPTGVFLNPHLRELFIG